MNRKEIDEIESFLKQLSEEADFEFELKLIKDWTELHIIVDYKRPEFGPSGWRLMITNYRHTDCSNLFNKIKEAVKDAATVDEDMDVLSEELENIQIGDVFTKMLFKEVIQLNENLMNNESCNLNAGPDAVLQQIMRDKAENFKYSSNELFEIYKKIVDEEAFEQMFKLFTGITFYEYLKKCKEAIDQQNTGLIL